MKQKHYKKQLSAFLNHELPPDTRQAVGEHLLHCQECRQEHDEIKTGAVFAQKLTRFDAPDRVRHRIEAQIREKSGRNNVATGFLSSRILAFGSLALIAVIGLSAVYLNLSDAPNAARNGVKETVRINKAETFSAWSVESLAGAPKILNSSKNDFLQVGEILETDSESRAKVDVANIGQVEIAPNSLVRLVNSNETEHRLALEYGRLDAKIFAPPRLFVVDTPTAKAVDLGCAYTLEVDKAGNSTLRVTSGYVALERGERESIVPAGAYCLTRRAKGLGTPFMETASAEFKTALRRFDFENGGRAALRKILETARSQDTLSLWHLLSRVPENDREKVFKKIRSFAALPEGVTREGVLKLDKQMLDEWRYQLEILWYE